MEISFPFNVFRAIEVRRNFLHDQREAGSDHLPHQRTGSETDHDRSVLKSRRPVMISDRYDEDSSGKKAVVAELFPLHNAR